MGLIKRLNHFVIGLYLCTVIGGCAFGTKMRFDNTAVALPPVAGDVAVAVWDARPYVLSGEKSPEWVGLQRSGFGIPYGVHTSSNTPLRREFAQSLTTSLNQAGASTRAVEIPDRMADDGAVQSLLPKAGKVVLLQVSQWRTDTMVNVNFDYDLKLSLFENGKVVASNRVTGSEKLVGSFWNPVGGSERATVKKQKEKLDELFAPADVRAALSSRDVPSSIVAMRRSDPSPTSHRDVVASKNVPTKQGGCSVAQILSMKNSGLNDSQIKAACGS